jgi:very-short-patch-repair endonuclease
VGTGKDNCGPRGLDDFSSQGLGNMAWAYARQAQLSEVVSDRLNLNTGTGKMSTYKTIYFDIGENLLLKFFSSIAETTIRVHDNLGKGKPQDIANTAWAFASLGLKDRRYMDATRNALTDRLSRYARGERNAVTTFKGQELANLLWAMATVNVSAGNVWTAVIPFLRSTCAGSSGSFSATSISRYFKRQELASMAWACSVFGNYPEELMQFLYIGLFGLVGKEREPKELENIFNDSGLQMQAIMTLIYVQTEIDTTGICRNLSLPEHFPDCWIEAEDSTNTKKDQITELSSELNLSTSKIQRAVSAAFLRIGFDHVEEHTITMQEMADVHGVRIPSKSIEVLSIDIANVQQKVAVEVDGPSHFVTRTDDNGEDAGPSGGYSKVINGKLEYQFRWNGERQEMNGPTVLKDRLLTSFGWKVLHLPFWEWYALGGDSVEEEKYCRLLLGKVM